MKKEPSLIQVSLTISVFIFILYFSIKYIKWTRYWGMSNSLDAINSFGGTFEKSILEGFGIIFIIFIIVSFIQFTWLEEYNDIRKIMNSKDGFIKYNLVKLTFKDFYKYYLINPNRYIFKEATVWVKSKANSADSFSTAEYIIVFSFIDYLKYRRFIKNKEYEKLEANYNIRLKKYLSLVQTDIDSFRELNLSKNDNSF